jgi:CHASE3 domain sensor protein
MSDLLKAQVFGAISSSISDSVSAERQAERARAKTLKAEQDAKLKKIQAQSTPETIEGETQLMQDQLKVLQEQTRNQLLSMTRQRTYDTFDRYSVDSDPRHITTFIQDARNQGMPLGPLSDIVRVDKLTDTDSPQIQQLGLRPQDVLNNPEVMKDLVRVTYNDGTTKVRSVDTLKGITNYSRYASDRERAAMRDRAEVLNLMRKGHNRVNTKDEREAARIVQQQNPELVEGSDEYAEKYNEAYASIVERNRATGAMKEEDEVDSVIDDIDNTAQEKYGKSFLDLSRDEIRRDVKLERKIERMERLGKLELSSAEKKKVGQIKQLIALGNRGSKITDEETGILDKLGNDVRKFVSDSVSGVEATSAFAAYRNILRNALYGSVLTDGEIKAFREQFGELTEKTGPLLTKFKTALIQLSGEMQALIDTNNSYVMHYRIGQDRDQLQDIIDGIQQRIDMIVGVESENTEKDVIPASRLKGDSKKPENIGVELSEDALSELDFLYQEATDEN